LPPALAQADCQQDSVLIISPVNSGGSEYDTVTAADMPLIQRIANLPEYHDCQRFVVPPRPGLHVPDSALAFGPLVAIWAADGLGSRFGVPEPKGPSRAVPVAIIHNFDQSATYEPLHIKPGFSCLYLWHDGTRSKGWRAMIVPFVPTPDTCRSVADPDSLAGGAPLNVSAVPLPQGLSPADIPEVTRWDWDAEQQRQYIGLRCAEQWCEVSGGPLSPSPSAFDAGIRPTSMAAAVPPIPRIPNGLGMSNEIHRVVTVKGWYDEQRLDLRDSKGKPVLTNIVGTVIPHPALDRAPFDSVGEWTPVAFINVTADYPGKVPLKRGMSRVFLCKETNGECHAKTTTACLPEPPDPASPTAPPTTWWTKIVAADNTVAYHCIRRRKHGGMAIPAAAARWNWHELDAKTWVQCGTACCTVN